MKKTRTAAPNTRSVEVPNTGWIVSGQRLANALSVAVAAIGPLDFEDKRRLLRWLCDVFMVDPAKLVQ